ncbi:kelch repeat and BTB domain-containing protein 12-like [Branchiostoma floridae]|uniref:Kelch repeat and BTB domain-containing protein 12-like n=1 Tax=Branchiostoma floridae TaxID=7739 RepID=A0A9J7LT24_BRAFL|nr:kelch repeat and BTB domain-containing protein 12-like [Branchiostoma floridae]
MFTSDMAESRQKTVVLQGLDAGSCGDILSYIYSGTLHVSLDKVQPLYQAADLLQLDYVRDTCSSYMAMNIERFSRVDLYKFADVFSADNVRKRCLQLILINFTEVASSKEFCSLSVNQLSEIISHDALDVKEETTVWEAVVRWVQHSREDRLQHLPILLPHIRFNLLTSDKMAAILEHPLIREDSGTSEVIRNVVKEASNLQTRIGMETLEMVLLFHNRKKKILYMNPRAGMFLSCSYSTEELHSIKAMAVTSSNITYFMATKESEEQNLLFLFHVENEWEHACMSSVTMFLRLGKDVLKDEVHLVEIDQILYYLGVETRSDSTLVRMKKYSWLSDQWQECSQLLVDGLSKYNAPVICGSYLYFRTKSEMRRYDPSQDQWDPRSPPGINLPVHTAVAIGTEIFCTDHVFRQIMVCDTESDSWQELQGSSNREFPSHLLISNPQFFVLENELYVRLEAYNTAIEGASIYYMVYVYDRYVDTWRDLKITLPNHYYTLCRSMCHVARMYRPLLDAVCAHVEV